jgi:hypothetical protein
MIETFSPAPASPAGTTYEKLWRVYSPRVWFPPGVTIAGPRIFICLPSALHQSPSIASANEICTDVSSIAKLAEAVSTAKDRWHMALIPEFVGPKLR